MAWIKGAPEAKSSLAVIRKRKNKKKKKAKKDWTERPKTSLSKEFRSGRSAGFRGLRKASH
jgi:hypothetical protein